MAAKAAAEVAAAQAAAVSNHSSNKACHTDSPLTQQSSNHCPGKPGIYMVRTHVLSELKHRGFKPPDPWRQSFPKAEARALWLLLTGCAVEVMNPNEKLLVATMGMGGSGGAVGSMTWTFMLMVGDGVGDVDNDACDDGGDHEDDDGDGDGDGYHIDGISDDADDETDHVSASVSQLSHRK